MQFFVQFIVLVIGFIMLMKGADWFVDGSSKIADRFGIPQLVIGLTIVACGTSAPEAAVSITAALRGSAEITIGNVVGSNIINILLILGITAVIIPLAVQNSTKKYEIPFVIVISGLLLLLGNNDGVISFFDGVILCALFVLFLIYLLYLAKSEKSASEEVETTKKNESIFKMLVLILIGMGLIIWGSDVSVGAATELANMLGLSERFIGLTIVAFGTSLPELITSITAAIKGNADIAIGNIVGSNIFNILFVVGITAIITPITFSSNFVFDCIICISAAALLLLCVTKNNKLTRAGGVIMLASYAVYFVTLIS